MQTVLAILKRAGGSDSGLYLRIENAPYMALVIEATGESGPMGLPVLSVAHYGEQNGDLMRDPEMCLEIGSGEEPHLDPFYFCNDYMGIEQWSRNRVRGHYVALTALHEQHRRFAIDWNNNLRLQGFVPSCACLSTLTPTASLRKWPATSPGTKRTYRKPTRKSYWPHSTAPQTISSQASLCASC